MSDVEFTDFGNACYRADVSVSQSMSGRDQQSILRSQCCAFAQTSQFLTHTQCAFSMKSCRSQRGFCISGSAQLDLLRVDFMRRLDLFWIRIDEEAGKNSRLAQPAHGGAHDRDIAYYVETALGGYLVRIFGNQGNCIRS